MASSLNQGAISPASLAHSVREDAASIAERAQGQEREATDHIAVHSEEVESGKEAEPGSKTAVPSFLQRTSSSSEAPAPLASASNGTARWRSSVQRMRLLGTFHTKVMTVMCREGSPQGSAD